MLHAKKTIATKAKARPQHYESKLQQNCVKWFGMQYAKYDKLLFAIPNGGHRSKTEAGILIGEGVKAGVADLMLAVPCSPKVIRSESKHTYARGPFGDMEVDGEITSIWTSGNNSHGLFIEMKYGDNKQSEEQKKFQKQVEAQGYMYEVVYTLESFMELINSYLK